MLECGYEHLQSGYEHFRLLGLRHERVDRLQFALRRWITGGRQRDGTLDRMRFILAATTSSFISGI